MTAMPGTGELPLAKRRRGITRGRSFKIGAVVSGVLGTAWAAIAVAPLYFLVLGSLRGEGAYLTANPWWPSGGVTLLNYRVALNGIGTALMNSVIVTVSVCALVVLLSVPAAYAIVRGRGKGIRLCYILFLAGLAIPIEGTIVSVFIIVIHLHLYNSLAGIIVPTAAFAIALAVLILVAFLRDVPSELYEAMDLDGAGKLQLLRSLVFPMARPPLLGIGVFVALSSWNSLLLPLVTTTSNSQAVLPVALLRLESSNGADYPAILASVVWSAIPIIVLYLVGRRQLIGGLVIGSSGNLGR